MTRLLDGPLGFTAGVMLAATAFSLLVPALDRGDIWEVLARVRAGLRRALWPRSGGSARARSLCRAGSHTLDPRRRQALLLVSALTIHNVPEGMAVGVAFAAGGADLGVPIALAIGSRTSRRASPPPRRCR